MAEMVAAEVMTVPTFEVGDRRVLFDGRQCIGNDDHRYYGASPNDRRFVTLSGIRVGDGASNPLILVENWLEELKAKVGN